eukprot:COSAG01_NODE_4007_length_5440_cov_3.804531_2_plen_71_part_00
MLLYVYRAHVTVLRLNLPPQVLDYTKPYNQGGWIALHAFTRCKVLTEQMRADDEQQAFMRRVRWGYSLVD